MTTPSSPTTMTGRETDGTTPRPWFSVGLPWIRFPGAIYSAEDPHGGAFIADTSGDGDDADRAEADAALIVAAVNDYDRLKAIEEAARAAFTELEASAYHRNYRAAAVDAHELLGSALAVKLREEG